MHDGNMEAKFCSVTTSQATCGTVSLLSLTTSPLRCQWTRDSELLPSSHHVSLHMYHVVACPRLRSMFHGTRETDVLRLPADQMLSRSGPTGCLETMRQQDRVSENDRVPAT